MQVGAIMSCLYEPRRLFNCDESGFAIGGRAGTRVLAEKGSKLVHELRNTDKTQVSVLVSLNAAGDVMPPLIIIPAKRTEVCGRYMDGAPNDAMFSATENGWIDWWCCCGSSWRSARSSYSWKQIIQWDFEILGMSQGINMSGLGHLVKRNKISNLVFGQRG